MWLLIFSWQNFPATRDVARNVPAPCLQWQDSVAGTPAKTRNETNRAMLISGFIRTQASVPGETTREKDTASQALAHH